MKWLLEKALQIYITDKPSDAAATTSTQIVSGGSPAWILPALYRSWC